MSNHELKSDFMRMKNEVLDKIQKTKEKWQLVWREARGNLASEKGLVHLMLEIQIREKQAQEEFAGLEKKIKSASGGGEK